MEKEVTREQFNPVTATRSVTAVDLEPIPLSHNKKRLTWGVGPYVTHRLFNPDLPLSMEAGIEVAAGYKLAPGLKISGAVRKSLLTNLTDNKRLDSGSSLPRVHSEWPLYDLAGQSGHVHSGSFLSQNCWAYGRARVWNLSSPELVVNYFTSLLIGGIGLISIEYKKNLRCDLTTQCKTTIGHVSLY